MLGYHVRLDKTANQVRTYFPTQRVSQLLLFEKKVEARLGAWDSTTLLQLAARRPLQMGVPSPGWRQILMALDAERAG